MQRRKPVAFQVPVKRVEKGDDGKPQEVTQWLALDGTLKKEQQEAATFRIQRSSTPIERARIEMVLHTMMPDELAGWVDLQRGIELRRDRINEMAMMRLWPEGRPEASGAALLEQNTAIANEWEALVDDPMMDQLGVLSQLDQKLRFFAAWAVLGVNHPEGWETLHDRDDIDEPTITAIQDAWEKAFSEVSAEQPRLSA